MTDEKNDDPYAEETLVEQNVTYTLQMNGTVFVVENVPARVNTETGEQFFSPQTVERLQQVIRNQHQQKPIRTIETPVFDYAA